MVLSLPIRFLHLHRQMDLLVVLVGVQRHLLIPNHLVVVREQLEHLHHLPLVAIQVVELEQLELLHHLPLVAIQVVELEQLEHFRHLPLVAIQVVELERLVLHLLGLLAKVVS